MKDCCRAAVIEEFRAEAKILRRKGRTDMQSGFAAGLLWSANFLEEEADALEAHDSAKVDHGAQRW